MHINTVLLLVLAISFIIIAVSTFIIAKNTSVYKTKMEIYTNLIDQDYNEALTKIDKLSSYRATYLKAYTLYKRNKSDDRIEAKKLFREVIEKNLWGAKQISEQINTL